MERGIRKKYLPLVFALGAALVGCMALTGCGADSHVKKGDAFLALGEYFDAAAEYKKAYGRTAVKDKAKRAERALKMARCYHRINYAAKAMGAYQNAVRYGTKDSTALLHLGQMQQRMGDYKGATKSFQTFLDTYDATDTLALNGLRGCELAPQWKAAPTLYTVKKEPLINGRRSDFSPALTGDDFDQLYFSTTRPQAKGDEISGITGTKSGDIWLSKKDEKGKWQVPEAVEGELNTLYDEGAAAFSPDGKTMYLTLCTYDSDYPRYAEIYTSQRSDASWSKPQKLELTHDTLSSYAHPAPSPDGKWLYFVSDMPGGLGGKDIWRIALGDHGMGGVENVGAPINTAGDELFPTFRPNGDLYFSSDGHPGMGGLDLFRARYDTLFDDWQVENLQAPMNSAGDDFGMTFEGLHNRGYFASSRGDARGWDHIWSFECPEVLQTVKGWVYEKDGYELPEGLVYMVGDDGTNKKLSVRGDGSFVEEVKPRVNYVFMGTCKGYLNHKEELAVDTSSVSREYVLQFPLASLTSPVLVRNVFYAYNSAEILDSSAVALDSLTSLLAENPNITIELSSHCDYRASNAYNLALSQRRAESVVKYLIAKGVDPERLTPVGYGEERPKVITKRLAQLHPFLHEGDTLTEAFIIRLPDLKEQEECNAMNRRTEFKVLRTSFAMDKFQEAQKAEATEQKAETTEQKAEEDKAEE